METAVEFVCMCVFAHMCALMYVCSFSGLTI